MTFEAEVETWEEVRKRGLLGAIKRKGPQPFVGLKFELTVCRRQSGAATG